MQLVGLMAVTGPCWNSTWLKKFSTVQHSCIKLLVLSKWNIIILLAKNYTTQMMLMLMIFRSLVFS